MTQEELRSHVVASIRATEEELETIHGFGDDINMAIDDWLENSVLEIERTQTLIDGHWDYTSYRFVVGIGGPTVWVESGGYAEGTWGELDVRRELSAPAKEALDMIAEYMDELID